MKHTNLAYLPKIGGIGASPIVPTTTNTHI
nr:MAG TPA: BTB/POZ domain-containing protein [Caudoviricetes sp.]